MPIRLFLAATLGVIALILAMYAQHCRSTAGRRERAQLARIAELASRGPREDY